MRCPEYEGPTEPSWIRGTIETPWLDASASIDDYGWITLAVVNVHETQGFRTIIDGVTEDEVDVYTVTGRNVKVTNTEKSQEVGIAETRWNGKGLFEFQKHSLTMLRWRISS